MAEFDEYKYMPRADGEHLVLKPQVLRSEVSDPLDNLRRALTKLEGKTWEGKWGSAYDYAVKAQGELDAILARVSEHLDESRKPVTPSTGNYKFPSPNLRGINDAE